MTNYNEYLEFNEEIDKQKQEEILPKINIPKEDMDDIKSISTSKKLLIFAEPNSKDCRLLVAMVERIRALNSANIDVEYLSKKDNMGKMKALTMESKIPTVFLVDGIKLKMLMEGYPTQKSNEEMIKSLVGELK